MEPGGGRRPPPGTTQPAVGGLPLLGQVTASSIPQVFSNDLNFDWSLVGTRCQGTRTNAQTDTFGYDTTHDVVMAAVTSGTHAMTVDAAGNRQTENFGACQGTRSGGGGDGVFWFVIPWTKKDVATELARFQEENPGVI